VIKAKNLRIKLDNYEIFEGLDFDVKKGRVTIIVGLNGTGKTTLMKALCGEIKHRGELTRDFSRYFYLPQKISYPNNLTLFEYLSSVFYRKNLKWSLESGEKDEIYHAIKEVELTGKENLKLEKLSSGELQKANIALALLSGAEILFLDEPTSNMDLINQIKILDILKSLKLTSVLILHDLNLASNYGDDFIGVARGGKIICENKAKFFKKEVLNDVFGLDFEVVEGEKNIFVQVFN